MESDRVMEGEEGREMEGEGVDLLTPQLHEQLSLPEFTYIYVDILHTHTHSKNNSNIQTKNIGDNIECQYIDKEILDLTQKPGFIKGFIY